LILQQRGSGTDERSLVADQPKPWHLVQSVLKFLGTLRMSIAAVKR